MTNPLPCSSLLVLGGARSGKSRHAQLAAEASAKSLVYIATGQAFDSEMEDRIVRHKAGRGQRWELCEEPLDLVAALRRESRADRLLLVDCCTLWLSNLMFAARDVERETAALAAALPALPGPLIFVSNEVGSGIVPDNELARSFRDAQGRLNQRLAAACTCAVLVVAGLPVLLKPAREFALAF